MAYSPASVLTSGTYPNLVATFYERRSVPNLKAETPFSLMAEQSPLPLHSGNQKQFYTYTVMAANTAQSPEGTVGTPIAESTTSITATVGQYADFISASDLSLEVAIDEPGLLDSLSKELTHRLALTLNSLHQTILDSATGVDGNVNIELANGTYLSANNIRSAVAQLEGIDALPKTPDGFYAGLMHPHVERDIMNDTSANGLVDIVKRSPDMAGKLFGPVDRENAVTYAGVKFKKTSTAPSGTVSGVTKFNTYICSLDTMFSIFLGKNPQTGTKNFALNIQEAPKSGSVSDPTRAIGGWVAYNVNDNLALSKSFLIDSNPENGNEAQEGNIVFGVRD